MSSQNTGAGGRDGVRDFLDPLDPSAAPHGFEETEGVERMFALCRTCGGGRLHPIHRAAAEAMSQARRAMANISGLKAAVFETATDAWIAAKASAAKPVKRARRKPAKGGGR
jgi:hypothetical protein